MSPGGGLPRLGKSTGQRELETENLSPQATALFRSFETYIRDICRIDGGTGNSHISRNNRTIRADRPVETVDGIRVQLVSWDSVDRALMDIIEGFDPDRCTMKEKPDDISGGRKVYVTIGWPENVSDVADVPAIRRRSIWSWFINEPKVVICGILLVIFSASVTTEVHQWKNFLAIVRLGVGG